MKSQNPGSRIEILALFVELNDFEANCDPKS